MILTTDRLILRRFVQEDFDSFAALLSDSEVMRFSLKGPCNSREEVQGYLQKIFDHDTQFGFTLYAVIDKHSQKLIGLAGFMMQEIDGEQRMELGYRLLPRYWGQGLAFEITTALLQYGFKNWEVDELISIIDPHNERSKKLALRLGMKLRKKTTFHNIPVEVYGLRKR